MANEKWSQQPQITSVDSDTTWLCAIDGKTPANRIIKPMNLGLLLKNNPSATGSFTLTANEPIIYLDSRDGCAITNKIGDKDVFSIQTSSAYMDSSIKSLNRLSLNSQIVMLRTYTIDNSAEYNVTLNQSGVFNMTGVTVVVADGVNAKDAVNKGQLDALKTPNLNKGVNYLMVYGTGTPSQNETELQNVYNAAKKMSPSASNVITIVVSPGNYGSCNFDTSYINVVSLTGNADVTIHDISPSVGQHSYFKGIVLIDFIMPKNSPNIILENCVLNGTFDSAGDANNPINSTLINCNIQGQFGTDGGNFAAQLIGCTIDTISIGNGEFTGLAENCTLKTGTFPTPTGAGKIVNCIDSTGNVINSTKVSVADGVNAKDAVNKEQLDYRMKRLDLSNGNIDINFIVNLVGLGFDLSYAQLGQINASNANLSMAYLSYAYFNGANFSGTNFSYADLSYAIIVDIASFTGSDFSHANLSYAHLDTDGLYNATWSHSILSNATGLSGKDLHGINFNYANLSNVNFSNSNLTNANFSKSTLTNTSWSGTYLVNANFKGASGLNSDINQALNAVNKNPNGDNSTWTLTWTDGVIYKCTPSTGQFSIN
jgi:uncharacterized protein YjbI with pentapeptide repeats